MSLLAAALPDGKTQAVGTATVPAHAAGKAALASASDLPPADAARQAAIASLVRELR
jgi:hypothetical protein